MNVPAASGQTVGHGAVSLPAEWLARLVQLEQRTRSAHSIAELSFILANEGFDVLPCHQVLVWDLDARQLPRLKVVSGLATLGEDSPYTAWLRRLAPWLYQRLDGEGVYFAAPDVPEAERAAWADWLPAELLVFRLNGPQGEPIGMVGFSLEEPFDGAQQVFLAHWLDCVCHAWSALLRPPRRSLAARLLGGPSRPWWKRWPGWLALGLLGALLVPVRLSVLAPAEVIALDAQTVTAPLDGVVKRVHVQPNQAVSAGQTLFSLDDTTLRNRREVALKQLAIARVDSQAAQQKAIGSEGSRQELAALQGKVAERMAEITALDDQLQRLEVKAPAPGVLVFGDVNDWLGKPVMTGERLALLADPKDAGLLIWLPVAEAINLEAGAELRFFLQVAPLTAMQARLVQTSYQANLSPEGVASYRLRARIEAAQGEGAAAQARIGLKGTAKIFGERAPLALYLFRRPLSTLREWVGW